MSSCLGWRDSQKALMIFTFTLGFSDYETLLEFCKYIEPSASNLTYYSSVRDTTQMNADDVFIFP